MKTSYNNCFVWAIYHWLRYGGYLVIRRANVPFGFYPHFMWMPELSKQTKILHFVPVRKNIIFPWPVFKGYVKTTEHRKLEKHLKKPKKDK